MPISRRAFLGTSGTALAVGALHSLPTSISVPALPTLTRMRALTSTRLFSHLHPDAPIVRRVWQHELLALHGMDERWAYTDDGCLPAADIQPVAAPDPAQPAAEVGWAEVIAPYATVHAWADDDAPQQAVIPIGSVVEVIDRLETRTGMWLGVTLEQGAIGWSRAAAWGKATFHEAIEGGWMLRADREAGQVMVIDRTGTLIGSMPATVDVPAGTFLVSARTPGDVLTDADGVHHGVPGLLKAGDLTLFGKTWHSTTPAPGQLALPAWAARWLFSRVDRVAVV